MIGNCQVAAQVDAGGDIRWATLPTLIDEPVFSSAVHPERGGVFAVRPARGGLGEQRYLGNTNVLETRFESEDGSFRVIDFAPRFIQYDRVFRPPSLMRVIEPLAGSPRISVRCEPRVGWSMAEPVAVRGSGTIEFQGFGAPLRLNTDIPLTALSGNPMMLTEKRHLVLSWGAVIDEPLGSLCERFLNETVRHWEVWVRGCTLPTWYQRDVLRAALALKLHCFEDTGAVVESLGPAQPGSPEARVCRLLESPRTASSFLQLGLFSERERLAHFLLNLAGAADGLGVRPAYWPDGRPLLSEAGTSGPDAAAAAAVVVAVAPLLLDLRFAMGRVEGVLALLERLTEQALARSGAAETAQQKPRTWPNVTRWAAAARMAVVAARHAPDIESRFRAAATTLHHEVTARAWNNELRSFTARYDGRELGSELLRLPGIGFLSPQDPRLRLTVDALWKAGAAPSTTGEPATGEQPMLRAFWLTHALAHTGRTGEARKVMSEAHAVLTPVGVVLDSAAPAPAGAIGADAHAGVIEAAFAVSPKWSEVM